MRTPFVKFVKGTRVFKTKTTADKYMREYRSIGLQAKVVKVRGGYRVDSQRI